MRAPTELGPCWREVSPDQFYGRVSSFRNISLGWAEAGPRYRTIWRAPANGIVGVSEWDPETGTKRYWLPA